jgi:hypothetical protein
MEIELMYCYLMALSPRTFDRVPQILWERAIVSRII